MKPFLPTRDEAVQYAEYSNVSVTLTTSFLCVCVRVCMLAYTLQYVTHVYLCGLEKTLGLSGRCTPLKGFPTSCAATFIKKYVLCSMCFSQVYKSTAVYIIPLQHQ